MSNIVNPSDYQAKEVVTDDVAVHESAAQDLLNNSLKYLQALAGQAQARKITPGWRRRLKKMHRWLSTMTQ
jgi:hypothetical protein